MSCVEVTFLLLLVWFALDYRIRNLKGTKMTDDDDDTQVYRSELEAAVKAAVEAEREACARVCEDEIKRVKPIYSVVAENALKAIRARGDNNAS